MSTKHQGWYSDPADATRYRWWTGVRWTNWLSDSDASLPPPIGLDGTLSARPQEDRTRGMVTTLIAGLVVVALVVATFTVLGMRQNAATAAAPVPSVAYGEPVLRTNYFDNKALSFNEAERELLLREGTIPLPKEPFTVEQASLFAGDLPGVLSDSVTLRYASKHRVLTVIGGTVYAGALTWDDPKLGGQHIARAILDTIGGEHRPTVDSIASGEPRQFGQRQGYPSTLTSSLTVEGKEIQADISVWLFQIEYDTWVSWIEIDTTFPAEQPDPNDDAALLALKAAFERIEFFTPAPR